MSARSYIIQNTDGEVIMWIAYHDFREDECSLSVAIAPEWQGRLVTRGHIREMFEMPFKDFGVTRLRMGLSNPKTLASLLSLGFNLTYDDGDVLLPKAEYEGKFGMRESL